MNNIKNDSELQFLNDYLTIVVIGFDGYSDVWEHNFDLMNKYWPDRPTTILADSVLNPDYKNVMCINAGEDAEWSKKLLFALDQVKTKYVLLLLEDFFITKKINVSEISSRVKLMEENDIKYFQLIVQSAIRSWVSGDKFQNYNNVFIVPSDKKYPLNLQAAIWNKEFLLKSVGTGNYNAWKFEMDHMSDKVNIGEIECLIDNSNVLNITHMVVQSKYLRSSVKIFTKQGYNIDLSKRSLMSKKDEFKYNFKLICYKILPKKFTPIAKKIGRKLGVDFVTDRLKNNDK